MAADPHRRMSDSDKGHRFKRKTGFRLRLRSSKRLSCSASRHFFLGSAQPRSPLEHFRSPHGGRSCAEPDPGRNRITCPFKRLGLAVGLVLCLLVTGCASRPPISDLLTPASGGPVWPAPPEEPRVAFVTEIQRPADLGMKLSWGRWLVNLVTGSNKGAEPFVKPFGISTDGRDHLCITDLGTQSVSHFDLVERKMQRWTKIGKYELVSPVAVAEADGKIFLADSVLGKVLCFDHRGRLLLAIGEPLERPAGLAISGKVLFVADAKKHQVFAFSTHGALVYRFGKRGSGLGELNYPTHLALAPKGDLLVTDSMNHRLQRFDVDGTFKGVIGRLGDTTGHFSKPKGIAVDRHGHVFAVDAIFDNIQVFDLSGRLLLYWGVAGNEKGAFWLPAGIAVDELDRVFVTDTYNKRIQVFRHLEPRQP